MNNEFKLAVNSFKAVILALIIRNLQAKFIKNINTSRSIGFLWIFVEPLLHIAAWVTLRVFILPSSHHSLHPIVFVFLGTAPFLYFRNSISASTTIIKSNKNYYVFRQIKPIDPIIAHILSGLFILLSTYTLGFICLKWFNINFYIYHFIYWICALFAFFIFCFGLLLLLSVLTFFIRYFIILMPFFVRILYVTSGLFFTAQEIPDPMRTYMLYNPIFTFIELSREYSMVPGSYVEYASLSYLITCAFISLFLGLLTYSYFSNKIMVDIQTR